jgi:hypothetical protein
MDAKYLEFNKEVGELMGNIKEAILDAHNKVNHQIQLKLHGQKTLNQIN